MPETVSVIIPTYNRSTLLPRALDSVLAQTRPADEILVIDDGSTDDTRALLNEHYPMIRYFSQHNSGVSAARNTGIHAARSEWLALLDSDDEWLPHKLHKQLHQCPADARIIHSDEIWIRNGKRVNPMHKHAKAGGWIYTHCLPLCAISPSAVLIHRSIFDCVGLFNEQLPACEDYDLWLRICARFPVHFIPEPLIIKYGGHDDQLSRRYWGMDRFRIQALEDILASGVLTEEHRQATLYTLLRKLDIYCQGAQKHSKQDELRKYLAKREYYAAGLNIREICT